MKKQLAVLEKEIEILKQNKKAEAVLLTGSVAYGTATDDSDLDLIVISNENRFVSKYTDGILVEIHFNKFDTLIKRLESNPSEVYKYLYSKVIFDNGSLAKLMSRANEVYDSYSASKKDMESISYWLSSTKIKLIAAINSNDEMKISYLLSTNTWKVLEGVWARNDKPMPPSGLAFAKHAELKYIPYDKWFNGLLMGNCISRAKAMLDIIDWVCLA